METKLSAQFAEQEQNKRLLTKHQQRVNELDAVLQKRYEDMASSKLSEERFTELSVAHEEEQIALVEKSNDFQ